MRAALLALALTLPAHAAEVAIEPDWTLVNVEEAEARLLAPVAAEALRAAGFACASVWLVRKMLTEPAWRIGCDNGKYVYDLRDRGGTWTATLRP